MTTNIPLYDEEYDEDRRRRLPIFGLRAVASIVALGAIAAVGVFTTQAALSDQVTMGQITVAGGSLDMFATADADDDDTDVAWTGNISVALTGMTPGDEESGTVEIANTGDLPFTLTGDTAGTDADGCFSYWLRETSVTGGTGAAGPVNLTGFGTAAGADATMAPFASAVAGTDLPDDGADLEWETDDKKVYTMTVRMNDACTANGATGTLDVTFDAAQV